MEFRVGVGVGVRGRNRPLRGFATHREANTPSGASAEGSGVRSQGLGVRGWSSELELESGIVDFLFRSFQRVSPEREARVREADALAGVRRREVF